MLNSAAEPDYPPLSIEADKHQADGFSVELLREAVHATGHDIKFKVDLWATIKQELIENKLDVLPLVARSPERDKVFDFSVPYLVLHGAIVVHKRNSRLKNLTQIADLNIGIMNGDFGQEYMHAKGGFNHLQSFNTYDEALKQLNGGKIDAVVIQELLAHRLIKEGQYNNLIISSRLPDFRQEFCFAVTEGDRETLSVINEGLSLIIANGTYTQLRNKWLGILEPEDNKNLFYAIITSIFFSLLAAYFISLLWHRSLRQRVKASTQELSRYQDNLEARILEQTRDLRSERERLKQAQEIAHIGNYVWEIEANKTNWSDNLYQLLGAEPGEFEPTYNTYLSFVEPEYKNYFMKITGTALRDKKAYSGEYKIRRKDDEVRTIFEQGEVKLDKNNNPLRLVGVLQDITEQKQMLSALKEQEDFNETVLEAAANVIVIIDIDGHVVRFNRAAEELTGYISREIVGMPVWDYLILPEQLEGVKNTFNNLRKGNTDIARHYENYWLTKTGEKILLDWSNSVLRDANGNITHIIALGYDLTAKKQDEQERDRLQRELNQSRKMEALGQLTGGIAHDFNNMLGIIIGYTDLALQHSKKIANTKLIDFLKNIEEASIRAKDLIAQMMVFSRNDIHKSKALDLKPLVEQQIRMLRSVIPSSITIKDTLENNLPKVLMDATQFQQILLNLSINAKDAIIDTGYINIKLEWHRNINDECLICHKHITGDWIELSFSDTGSGIESHVLEHIFEPFFTTKPVGKGSGLGLSVLQTIVENHHGHVLIDSLPGKGTTIRILLPALTSDITKAVTEAADNTESVIELDGQQKKILIVDDELHMATYIKELLSGYNFNCIIETDSSQALSFFQSQPADIELIITDQTMPVLTGVDMIKQMRVLNSSLPAILMTGYSETINRIESEKRQIIFLDKPLDKSSLLNHVKNCMNL